MAGITIKVSKVDETMPVIIGTVIPCMISLSRADLHAGEIQLVIHAFGGLLVLLVPAALSVYKPAA